VNHVAIDLGSKESQVCIRQMDGTILVEKKHPTKGLGELMKTWPKSRVILETSSEAFRIADQAKASGHEVRVVPATLVRELGVGARRVKTDERDARKLSEVSCRIEMPSVHIPSESAREFRSILGSRENLLSSRTKLVNNVRGWMRTQLWRIRSGGSSTLPERVRAHAQTKQQPLPEHVERLLQMIEMFNIQMKAADQQLRKLAGDHSVTRRLMTVPGVGPVTALSFLASIDEVSRFPNAHAVQSYLGLTPGENSSSERRQRTGITKAGPAYVRRTLIQAAWSVFYRRPSEPMVQWATQIAERRGTFIAIVALARKIAGILFAMWRDVSPYRPSKSAMPEITPKAAM
jgi:transposase